ncbi:hypothetical protein HDV64DRAFT_247571 [Trichoderma sp. TUCIM 5745]
MLITSIPVFITLEIMLLLTTNRTITSGVVIKLAFATSPSPTRTGSCWDTSQPRKGVTLRLMENLLEQIGIHCKEHIHFLQLR